MEEPAAPSSGPRPDDAARHPQPDVSPDLQSAPERRGTGLAAALLLYSALRVALVVALTAALSLVMPFIVALLFAIVVQLPLSWLLFAGPRRRVTAAIAAASAERRAHRDRLQAALDAERDPREP